MKFTEQSFPLSDIPIGVVVTLESNIDFEVKNPLILIVQDKGRIGLGKVGVVEVNPKTATRRDIEIPASCRVCKRIDEQEAV